MARVKRGVTSRAKHKKVLKAFKTFLCFALLVTPLLTLAILSS